MNAEQLAECARRILHDANTGRNTPGVEDPADYVAMAEALIREGWTPNWLVNHEALKLAYAALVSASATCPYHGADFGVTGIWWGQPRCDSCKQPARIAKAVLAVREALGLEARND